MGYYSLGSANLALLKRHTVPVDSSLVYNHQVSSGRDAVSLRDWSVLQWGTGQYRPPGYNRCQLHPSLSNEGDKHLLVNLPQGRISSYGV